MNKKYEAVFIIKNSAKEELKEIKNKIEMIVKQKYCEIYERNEWGLRKLAYDVQGEHEGYYYQICFENQGEENAISAIEASIRTVEEILKYLVVRLND